MTRIKNGRKKNKNITVNRTKIRFYFKTLNILLKWKKRVMQNANKRNEETYRLSKERERNVALCNTWEITLTKGTFSNDLHK